MAIRLKGHKYGAKQTIIDGIQFASKAEAQYYQQLKLLKRAGEVIEIQLQPRYELIPAYVNPEGKKVRPTYYIADFLVTYKDGRQEVIDVKGHKTEVYKLKKRLFEYKYNMSIKEVSA